MLLTPELDPTTAAIVKLAVGTLVTIVAALLTWLGMRVVRLVRWWIGEEAFKREVMGDPEKGKPSLRALGEQAVAAASKASSDVAGLYAIMGLTPGKMQAVQTGAMREVVRQRLSPDPEPEPQRRSNTGRWHNDPVQVEPPPRRQGLTTGSYPAVIVPREEPDNGKPPDDGSGE